MRAPNSFVSSAQERLAKRLILHAEHEAIEEKARAGMIPEGVAEAMLEDLAADLRGVRASQPAKLTVGPEELLKNVPFFADMPETEFSIVSAKLRRRTAPAGEIIVRQGGSVSSLFLVARGVVRVCPDKTADLAGTWRRLSPGNSSVKWPCSMELDGPRRAER
jgi:hypothetical protein